MQITTTQLKAIIDSTFAAVEATSGTRPLLLGAEKLANGVIDNNLAPVERALAAVGITVVPG